MSRDDIDELAPSEAELLLPWYVSGKLSEADRAKVDAWLKEDPAAPAHLERAMEEMDVTTAASEALGAPAPAVLDRLMERVERDAGPRKAAGAGWVERVWAVLSPRYAMAGAAALCLLVLGQAVVIGMMSQQDTGGFQVASDTVPTGPEVTALVAFAEGASFEEVSARLSELGLRIADGPKPGGVYVVAAPESEDGQAALDMLAADGNLVRFFSARE